MQRILIIEDDLMIQSLFARCLEDRFDIEAAYTLEEAEKKFEAGQGAFSLIVVDACLGGAGLETLSLVCKMSTSFRGPIIASSSCSENRRIMLRSGCTHETEKMNVPRLVAKLLNSAT